MDGSIGISSDSESHNSSDNEDVRSCDKNVSLRESKSITTDIQKETIQNSTNSENKDNNADSGDEYISDSSSLDLEEEKKEVQPIKEKSEQEENIFVLPSPKPKGKVFELNGMKVTVRKRSSHKKSHRTI